MCCLCWDACFPGCLANTSAPAPFKGGKRFISKILLKGVGGISPESMCVFYVKRADNEERLGR